MRQCKGKPTNKTRLLRLKAGGHPEIALVDIGPVRRVSWKEWQDLVAGWVGTKKLMTNAVVSVACTPLEDEQPSEWLDFTSLEVL